MAALKIGRRTPKQEMTSSKRDKDPISSRSKCPVFTVQYLGKLPARGEYGREYISEPVECLLKLKEKQRLPKTTLTVSEKGFHFLDQNGPFGKEKHVLIPLHNICYGVADEQSPRVFAIITRSDSNSASSLFECHAFLCDKRKTSSEITYWLLRTFLQVFEELQKKRRLRQDKKRQENGGNNDGRVAESSKDARGSKARLSFGPEKPFETGSYSVILEGSKGHGAAVGLTLDKSRSRNSHVTSRQKSHGNEQQRRNEERDLNANFYSRSPQDPLITINADVHPHPSTAQLKHRLPHHQVVPQVKGGSRSTYIYSGGVQPPPHTTNHQGSNHHRHQVVPNYAAQRAPSSVGRYTRNNPQSQNGFVGREGRSVAQPSSHDDSDFLFIELLQEEFTDGRHQDGFSVRSGRRGEVIGPPNQMLRSEDIERRIHEWLSAREEPSEDDISVFAEDETVHHPPEILRRQFSGGDTVSVASSDSYF